MTPVDAGPRPCIPGIRETACASPGAPDAAAGGDATLDATIAPAMPQVFPDVNNTIGLPLHPELSRPCARASSYTLENVGDAPLTVNDLAQAGSPEFSVVDENCRGSVLDTSSRVCQVKVCFASQVPGTRDALLTLSTTAGDVQIPLSNQVLPWTSGLDATVGNQGVVLISGTNDRHDYVRGVIAVDDGATAAVWSPGGFNLVSAGGALRWISIADVAAGYLELGVLRAGASGQGIYALLSTGALVRFLDDGTRDTAFGGGGTVSLGGSSYFGIAVQRSGRILAVGTSPSFTGARAFLSDGAEDLTYRTSFANQGKVTIDDRGRLYVVTINGVIRLFPAGGIDPGFAYHDRVDAMIVDREQRLVVVAMGTVVRLDDAGVPSLIPLASTPDAMVGFVGGAVDARGRLLLTTFVGATLRYLDDGTFDGRVGFTDGSAFAIACPPVGGCWIAGMAGSTYPAPNFHENYVLRLAP
jgi:hypothetical protein